jgi:hypothetical protein
MLDKVDAANFLLYSSDNHQHGSAGILVPMKLIAIPLLPDSFTKPYAARQNGKIAERAALPSRFLCRKGTVRKRINIIRAPRNN